LQFICLIAQNTGIQNLKK